MIAELTLPRLGETMETGRIVAWLKQPGESFRRGETLVEIESDKTVVEMPALADGVLAEILVSVGQDADVGATLCRYEDGHPGEAAPVAAIPTPMPDSAPDSAPELAPADPVKAAPATIAAATALLGKVRATPPARLAARRQGIALSGLVGTGRRGRIETSDVHADTGPQPAARSHALSGGKIAYRDWKSDNSTGPRIVLLHGLAADTQSWATLAAALKRAGRHVTALDLPGHGATDIEAGSVDEIVAELAHFLGILVREPIELVGHSLGGALAAKLARSKPSLVARVTLLAPLGLDRAVDTDFIRGIAQARSSGALQHLLRRLAVRPAALTSTQREALATELGRGRLEALVATLVDEQGQQVDITDDLQALTMPARLVWGVQDRIIPWTQVCHAGSRTAIHLIQDAGHVPHWDQPAKVAALFD